MEVFLGLVIFMLTFYIIRNEFKNSPRSRMLRDYHKKMDLTVSAMNRGNWSEHKKLRSESEQIYEMIRRYDETIRRY